MRCLLLLLSVIACTNAVEPTRVTLANRHTVPDPYESAVSAMQASFIVDFAAPALDNPNLRQRAHAISQFRESCFSYKNPEACQILLSALYWDRDEQKAINNHVARLCKVDERFCIVYFDSDTLDDVTEETCVGALDTMQSECRRGYVRSCACLTKTAPIDVRTEAAHEMFERCAAGITADCEAVTYWWSHVDESAATHALAVTACFVQGSAETCVHHAFDLERTRRSPRVVRQFLEYGCRLDPEQCFSLANLYLRESIPSPYPDRAWHLYEHICKYAKPGPVRERGCLMARDLARMQSRPRR